MTLLFREPSGFHLLTLLATPSLVPHCPGLWLSLRPWDSGKADIISFISPCPQVQHKTGLWERKFKIPFSASPCPQLSVHVDVILMNEWKKRPEGQQGKPVWSRGHGSVSQDHKSHVAIPLPPSRSLGHLRKSAREEIVSFVVSNIYRHGKFLPVG